MRCSGCAVFHDVDSPCGQIPAEFRRMSVPRTRLGIGGRRPPLRHSSDQPRELVQLWNPADGRDRASCGSVLELPRPARAPGRWSVRSACPASIFRTAMTLSVCAQPWVDPALVVEAEHVGRARCRRHRGFGRIEARSHWPTPAAFDATPTRPARLARHGFRGLCAAPPGTAGYIGLPVAIQLRTGHRAGRRDMALR